MTVRQRAAVVGFGVVVATAMASGAVSWACTAQSTLQASAVVGVPRAHVAVTGSAVALAAGAPVEIRWGTLDGPVLATVDAPNRTFSADVVIPDAPAGVSYLIATSDAHRLASVAFQVLPTGGESATTPRLTDFWPKLDPSSDARAHALVPASNQGRNLALGTALISASVLGLGAVGLLAGRSRKVALGRG